MSEARKHSPLPWLIGQPDCYIEDAEGFGVARIICDPTGEQEESDKGNAALIVEAVNSHAFLECERIRLGHELDKMREIAGRLTDCLKPFVEQYACRGGHTQDENVSISEAYALLDDAKAAIGAEVES